MILWKPVLTYCLNCVDIKVFFHDLKIKLSTNKSNQSCNSVCEWLCSDFVLPQEPEFSWRRSQKIYALLWGTRGLPTVRHQSLCQHLWFWQQGMHQNTHILTQSHKLTLRHTIMLSQWRLSLSQIVENCICILRNLSFRLELEMSPSWLTANQELDGLMGSESPRKEADYSCWGRKRRKNKNLLEEQVRLTPLHHQRGFNSTLK